MSRKLSTTRRHGRLALLAAVAITSTLACTSTDSKTPDPSDDLEYEEDFKDSDSEVGDATGEQTSGSQPAGPGGPAAQKAAQTPNVPKAVRERCRPIERDARPQVEIGVMQSIPLDAKGNPKPGVYGGVRCR